MPRRKQSHPQPVKCGAEDIIGTRSDGLRAPVLAADVLLGDGLELCDGTERLLSLSKEDTAVCKMEIPCYPLSEDEYSAYRPLSADSDPEEAGMGNLASPCGPCELTESSRCLYLTQRLSSPSIDLESPTPPLSEEKERLLFSCRLCPFSTHYSSHLKRHMNTHNGEKPFRCSHCLYASSQLVNLKRHLLTHTGEKPFHCRLCSFSCSSPGNLKRHQRVHTQEKPYTCHLCPYRCNQRRNLKRHILVHRRRRRQERKLQSANREGDEDDGDKVERGAGSVPPADVPVAVQALPVNANDLEVFVSPCARLSCTQSPSAFQPPRVDRLPGLLFPFPCRSCGSVLDENCSQTGEEEDGDMTQGPYCSRCSLSPSSPDRSYTCDLCPFVTHYPNHLSRHMKTHSGEKPYKCPLCSYASAHYDNLKRHQRVHTGEKPYKCQLCDYACGNLANLKRHVRIHSGDKPFCCSLCSYSCNQSMNLKRHMLRHTGEKPFCCAQCQYTTGHWDNYKRHQKTHGQSEGPYDHHDDVTDRILNSYSAEARSSETES